MGFQPSGAVPLSRRGQDELPQQRWIALGSLYAKLAGISETRADIVFIGDSITESYNASVVPDRGYVNMTAKILRARLGLSANGGRGFISATPGVPLSFPTWPVVRSAGNAVNAAKGPSRDAALLFAGQTLTFSLVGTSADIMWNANTGSFNWSVDGGGTTLVSGGVGQDGAKIRVALGASGAHSLVLTSVSDCYIDGVIEYNGDENTGILCHNCGHSAWTSASWLGNGAFSWTSLNDWPNSIAQLAPAVIVVMLGTNDLTGSINATQYKTNIQTLIDGLRQGNGMSQVPFILAPPFRRGDSNYSSIWPAYIEALQSIEQTDPLTVMVDISSRLPAADAAQTFGLYAGDKIHPVDRGHALIAATIASAFLPS